MTAPKRGSRSIGTPPPADTPTNLLDAFLPTPNLDVAKTGTPLEKQQVLVETLALAVDHSPINVKAQLTSQYQAALKVLHEMQPVTVVLVGNEKVRDDLRNKRLQRQSEAETRKAAN